MVYAQVYYYILPRKLGQVQESESLSKLYLPSSKYTTTAKFLSFMLTAGNETT